jgi:hypothetical protein
MDDSIAEQLKRKEAELARHLEELKNGRLSSAPPPPPRDGAGPPPPPPRDSNSLPPPPPPRSDNSGPPPPPQRGANFIAAEAFSGAKEGYAFKSGGKGVGYYREGSGADSCDDEEMPKSPPPQIADEEVDIFAMGERCLP